LRHRAARRAAAAHQPAPLLRPGAARRPRRRRHRRDLPGPRAAGRRPPPGGAGLSLPRPIEGLEMPRSGPLVDRFGRRHTYLRVSVTDRCNFRCTYCRPAEGLDWMPRDHLLTYEEVARVVGVLVDMGIE